MCSSMQFHRFDLHSGGERSYQFFGGEEGRSDILHYPEFLKNENESLTERPSGACSLTAPVTGVNHVREGREEAVLL